MMFGFNFRENFNYPYISQSMQDFWRRWHISVSTWFKEYLYIPLGGNRKGKFRTAVNRLIVFFCTGLWHGASLNFIVWGLINGIFMMTESVTKPEKWLRPFRHIYTMLITILAFVFFRAEDLPKACKFIGHMFCPSGDSVQTAMFMSMLNPMYILMFVLAIVFSMPVVKIAGEKANTGKSAEICEFGSYAVSIVLLVLCILTLSANTYSPFIYFRF